MKKAAYKLHLKKDDIVEVISGKEKGKRERYWPFSRLKSEQLLKN